MVAFGLTALQMRANGRHRPPERGDAIVVFGAAIWPSGPSPELVARVDRAADLFHAGYAPLLVCCGGGSEGRAMKEALVRRGVPAGAIVADDRGPTTRAALEAVARRGAGRWRHVVLVSSPYHLHRLRGEARRRGLSASTVPATLRPFVWFPKSGYDARLLSWQLRRQVREVAAIWWYALRFRPSTIDAHKAGRAAAASARIASICGGDAASRMRPDAPSGTELLAPVEGVVRSRYGWRLNRLHEGIDFPAGEGTPVRSAADGRVLYAGELEMYGRVVIVGHAGDLATVYGHLSTIAVERDQQVTGGELIGGVGSTGNSLGPHLHFELRVRGTAIDPLPHLPAVTQPVTAAARRDTRTPAA